MEASPWTPEYRGEERATSAEGIGGIGGIWDGTGMRMSVKQVASIGGFDCKWRKLEPI